jgi:hypothetical protein
MSLDDTIEATQRAQTKQMINYRPEFVILYRSTTSPDGSGGIIRSAPSPLAPQEMRLIPVKSITDQAPLRVTSDGQQVSPDWYLLGLPEADMKVGDTTTVRGRKLEIVYVSDMPEGRIVAECWENN